MNRKNLKHVYLDISTSHGGWPDGHKGSYTDNKTPVNIQILNYLEDMCLLDENNILSEKYLREYISLFFNKFYSLKCGDKIWVEKITVGMNIPNLY